MPALLSNLKIDSREKFELFKITLSDLSGLFEECHIKIRGTHSQECVTYAQGQLGDGIHLYQELQGRDWVAATLEMLSQVKARSVLLYFEDHRLVAARERLEETLVEFDKYELDYLCYSFFKASQLGPNNLLPLDVIQRESFIEFPMSRQSIGLVGKISPNYFTFSLLSLVSVEYFLEILKAENKKLKIFNGKLIALLSRLFPYMRYRRVVEIINDLLAWFSARLGLYPPSSPFNLEKAWYESILINRGWKFGVLRQELFANFDDDNGAYGESLIKRGLYPFDAHLFDTDGGERMKNVVRNIILENDESFDCTYYSHNGRIRRSPRVEIFVIRGNIVVLYQGVSFPLSSGAAKLFYSNLGPVIKCVESSEVKIKIFDEAF